MFYFREYNLFYEIRLDTNILCERGPKLAHSVIMPKEIKKKKKKRLWVTTNVTTLFILANVSDHCSFSSDSVSPFPFFLLPD